MTQYSQWSVATPESEAMNHEALLAAYTAPGRHYHNLQHIEDCLAALARVDNLPAGEREILEQAIWWHDVVYDPTRSDNEELSARLAEQHIRADLGQEVGRLIRLTKTHKVEPEDRLGAILISIASAYWARSLRDTTPMPRRSAGNSLTSASATIATVAPASSTNSPRGR
jgi:predicted metal-dependent HD superfamily phosphohydrolase